MTRVFRQTGDDKGFTLIELLVVMIIIGLLAAIAVPIFLSQRKKAQDASAKADISKLGKEIATYYVDGLGATASPMAITPLSGRYVLNVAAVGSQTAVVDQDLGRISANNVLFNQFYTDGKAWCLSLKNASGDKATAGFKYSAAGGLDPGVCTTSAG